MQFVWLLYLITRRCPGFSNTDLTLICCVTWGSVARTWEDSNDRLFVRALGRITLWLFRTFFKLEFKRRNYETIRGDARLELGTLKSKGNNVFFRPLGITRSSVLNMRNLQLCSHCAYKHQCTTIKYRTSAYLPILQIWTHRLRVKQCEAVCCFVQS